MNIENVLVSQLLNLIASQQKNSSNVPGSEGSNSSTKNTTGNFLESSFPHSLNNNNFPGSLASSQIPVTSMTNNANLNINKLQSPNNNAANFNAHQYVMQQLMLQQLAASSSPQLPLGMNNSDLFGKAIMSNLLQSSKPHQPVTSISPQNSNNELNLLLSLMAAQKQASEPSNSQVFPSMLQTSPQMFVPQPLTANNTTTSQQQVMLQLQNQLQLMQQNQIMQQILLSQGVTPPGPTQNVNDSLLLASLMGLSSGNNNAYMKSSSPASSCSSNQGSSELSKISKSNTKTNRSNSPGQDRNKRKRKNSTENVGLVENKSMNDEAAKRFRNTVLPDDSLYHLPLKMGWKRETIVKGVGPAGIFGDVSYVTPCGRRLWKIERVFEHLNSQQSATPPEAQLTVKAFNFRSTFRLGDYFEYNAETNQTLKEIPHEKIDRLLESEFGGQSKSTPSSVSVPQTANLLLPPANLILSPSIIPSLPGNSRGREEEILKELSDPSQIPKVMEELTKFFHHLIDEQKRFEERYEIEKTNFIKAEKEKLFLSSVEQGISAELKKQVDDLRLINSLELPSFDEIKGLKMPSKVFSDCLVIQEFLYAFNDCFAIDKESIPTMMTFQAAFHDRQPKAIDAVIHLAVELLRFAFVDPGINNTKLYTMTTGRKFSEIEIDFDTFSGVLRAFIIGRNGYENEVSDWLEDTETHETKPDGTKSCGDSDADNDDVDGTEENDEEDNVEETRICLPTRNYRDLSGDKQCSLLAFIVEELACNSKVVQVEVDKTMDIHLALKRDKWAIDNKIRRLKMILNRKCLGPNLLAINEANEASRLNNGEKDQVLQEFGWNVSKPTLTQNTIRLSEMDFELPPSDDEEAIDLGPLEMRIKRLHTIAEVKQKLIDECLFKLWGSFLGQDRFKRNYHLFGSLGGMYVEGPLRHSEADSGFNDDLIIEEILRRRKIAKSRDVKKLLSRKRSTNHENLDKVKVENPEEDMILDEKKVTEPMNLEVKEENQEPEKPKNNEEIPDKPVVETGPVKEKSDINLSPDEQQELCEKFGLDDTILTTAALLYITQNNIAETQGSSLWQTLALEYKKILTQLVSNELSVLKDKQTLSQDSISKCLLHLSDWLKKNKDPNVSKFDVDHEAILAEIPANEIDENVTKSLLKLNIQSETYQKIPSEFFNTWRLVNYSGENLITEYMRVCAQRGIREKNLSKTIRKNEDLVISTMQMTPLEFPDGEENTEDHRWIKIRSRRNKGRAKLMKELSRKSDTNSIVKSGENNGHNTSVSSGIQPANTKDSSKRSRNQAKDIPLAKRLAIVTGNDSHLDDPDYVDECNLIEEIERLEDRVLSSSLQKKGWQASVRMIDDDSIYLISAKTPRKSKMDQFPIDVAKSKLLQLQENIETRYLVAQSLASCDSQMVNMNDWIGKVNSSTKASQIRSLVKDFAGTLAWHKSIMKVLCQICSKDNNEAALLLCDGCDQGFHMYCFRPVLEEIPDGNWFCYDCQCKKSDDDLKLCFICGHEEGGKVEIESIKSTTASRKLACCENCQRCVHPECLRPPQNKLAKKWSCSGCQHAVESKSDSRKKGPAKRKPDLQTPVKTTSSEDTSESVTNTKKTNGGSRSCINGVVAKAGGRAPSPATTSKAIQQGKKRKLASQKSKSSLSVVETETADSNSNSENNSSSTNNGNHQKSRRELREPLWPENPKEFQYMNDEILEYCRVSTTNMINHESSEPFRSPVNAKLIPMYRKIIKKPMDLSYILRKCNPNSRISYRKFKNWVDHVRQIFLNCEIFNEDDSVIGKSGHNMCVYFEREILNPETLGPLFQRCKEEEEEEEEDDDDDDEEEEKEGGDDNDESEASDEDANDEDNVHEIPNITQDAYCPSTHEEGEQQQECNDNAEKKKATTRSGNKKSKTSPSPPNLEKPSPSSADV